MTKFILQFKRPQLILGLILAWNFLIFNFPANAKNNIEWQEAECQIKLINYDQNVKKEGTVLEALVKESGRSINDLLEGDNKTIKIFEVKYRAPIKLKDDIEVHERDIVQIGLYKALHPKIQSYLQKGELNKVKIKYATRDPILIEFIAGNEAIPAPAMITNSIDEK